MSFKELVGGAEDQEGAGSGHKGKKGRKPVRLRGIRGVGGGHVNRGATFSKNLSNIKKIKNSSLWLGSALSRSLAPGPS